MQRFFSADYLTARGRFLERASKAGAAIDVVPLDVRGPGGEDLAIDIAWLGARSPRNAVLHSSGLHGVEGFAGSAIQLSLLEDTPPIPQDCALILVHILNPYGMAWLRRVNENNVDLNRNCIFDGKYSGAPDGYRILNSFLNPPTSPSPDLFALRAVLLILRHGFNTLKQSVVGGQYEYPRGLFFGGKQLEKGIAGYRNFIRRRLSSIDQLISIDVHTGLGPYGEDSLLVQPQDYEWMKGAFGSRVSASEPERSPAYRVTGGIESMILNLFPRPKSHCVCQEFGTFGPLKVLGALRQENRWHHYGDGTLTHPAKQSLKKVFFPGDEAWQDAVLRRGRALVSQSLELLSN